MTTTPRVTTIHEFTTNYEFCLSMASTFDTIKGLMNAVCLEENGRSADIIQSLSEYTLGLVMLSKAKGIPTSWLYSMYPASFEVILHPGMERLVFNGFKGKPALEVANAMILEACSLMDIQLEPFEFDYHLYAEIHAIVRAGR